MAPKTPPHKNLLMDHLLNQVQIFLQPRNKSSAEILQDQLHMLVNKGDVLNKPAAPLHAHDMAIQPEMLKNHMHLMFQCAPNIAKKLPPEKLKTPDGQTVLKQKYDDKGIKILEFWNEETQEYDEYEEIYAAQDAKTDLQTACYYDCKHKRLTFNFGGTDFSKGSDMVAAAQTVSGSVDKRMTGALGAVNTALDVFEERYPGQQPRVDCHSHSVGCNAMPLANIALQQRGFVPDAQVMIEPMGAKNSFQTVALMMSKANGQNEADVFSALTANSLTIKPELGTFIDGMTTFDKYNHNGPANVPASVGTQMRVDVPGNAVTRHMGKAWADTFIQMAWERAHLQEDTYYKPAALNGLAPA